MRAGAGLAALVVAGALGAMAAPVAAAPTNSPKALHIPVDCGSAGTFDVVVVGGSWASAHDTDTNQIFVPTSFGEFTGTFTPAGGGAPQPIDEQPSFKHTADPAGKTLLVDCDYSVTIQMRDGTVQGTGTVTAFIANPS